MVVCTKCGEENPAKAKFCSECATPLRTTRFPTAEERKVVSILFVDLVGFTARSHEADPEDVRAALKPYHQRLKQESERFGGTVEKFIGDAVMTVFGAPVAHEDDAERAVRAALRITEAIQEMNEGHASYELAIRGAVNTGEVLVSLSEEMGQGLVGDVINTASRLQGVAPVNGIVVGEATYRATRGVIDYEPLEAVTVKGKPEPIPIWRAIAARSRFGVDVDMAPKTPFIGRDFDLAALRNAFQRTLRESSVQLVTITGEPGVGKTRLLSEFSSYIDDQDELVYWRQGRSLPYGEGITFWALGEIIKAQTGILESDGPGTASDKLEIAVDTVVEETDERTWFVARLGPLVGTKGSQSGGAEKEESFTAWRRFLEAIASRGPLVVVFEDLHWADAAMLEFIDHLVEWSTGVPLLVLCTARPELYESHRGWGGGKRNSNTISLSPLSDSETAQLISALLSQAVLPAEVHAALLERAGGNPLYAEEFIRMLWDRGVLQRKGRVLTLDPDSDILMPDNVKALIAARLDTLPSERKALLHDASVAGKVFWSGAVSALGERDDREVREGLHELARKEFVRPARNSSMEGQQEYSFWHALIRDVAYGQIPRAAKGVKHRAMAEWIESIAGDRVGDQAEVLAHHYQEALQLAHSCGDEDEVHQLEPHTCRFVIMAGDRASRLDMAKSAVYYEKSLTLLPSGDSRRGHVMAKAAEVNYRLGRLTQAYERSEDALSEFDPLDEILARGNTMTKLSILCWDRGEMERSSALAKEAVQLLEREGPSKELARAYGNLGEDRRDLGLLGEGAEWIEKSLNLARQVGDIFQEVSGLSAKGTILCEAGDMTGLTTLREALQLALERSDDLDDPRIVTVVHLTLGQAVHKDEGPSKGLELFLAGLNYAERRGMFGTTMEANAFVGLALFELGRWQQALAMVEETLAWASSQSNRHLELEILVDKTRLLVYLGRNNEATALAERFLAIALEYAEPRAVGAALTTGALTAVSSGDLREATTLIREFAQIAEDQNPRFRAEQLPEIMRILVTVGDAELVDRLMLSEGDASTLGDKNAALTAEAILSEAREELDVARDLYREAAQRWADYGFVLEEGQAHLGLARCLNSLGEREAATEPLQRARGIFEGLGAVPLLNEVDGYLEDLQAASG